jgi:hypothetical protein
MKAMAPRRRIALVATSTALIGVGALLSGDVRDGVVGLAPLLALVLTLIAGHYPGERLLEALVPRRRAPRRPPPRVAPSPRVAAILPRGGSLVASAMAGRAPPRRWEFHRSCSINY